MHSQRSSEGKGGNCIAKNAKVAWDRGWGRGQGGRVDPEEEEQVCMPLASGLGVQGSGS